MPYRFDYEEITFHRAVFETALEAERIKSILSAVRDSGGQLSFDKAEALFPKAEFSAVDTAEKIAALLINNYINTNKDWNITYTSNGKEITKQVIPRKDTRLIENLYAKTAKSEYGKFELTEEEIKLLIKVVNTDSQFIFGSGVFAQYVEEVYARGE